MVEKLKSVLKIAQLRLILKALIFGGLLLWVRVSEFTFWPVLVFVLFNFVLYFRNQTKNISENFWSFVVLVAASLYGVSLLTHPEFLLLSVIFFSFLFYVSLGIKEFILTNRYEWNYLKNLFLIYSIFLSYFLSDKYNFFTLKFMAVFICLFLVVREWLSWLYANFPKRYNLVAITFSFLTLQFLWAISLLPLGFINSATLIMVIFYLGLDFLFGHFRGLVNRKFIIKNSIIFILSIFIIFFFTNWKI